MLFVLSWRIVMKNIHDVTIPLYKKYKRCPFCYSRLTLSGWCKLKSGKELICYKCNRVIQNGHEKLAVDECLV